MGKRKAMTIKKVKREDMVDENGERKKTGAIKREYDLAKERFFRKPYGEVWETAMAVHKEQSHTQ